LLASQHNVIDCPFDIDQFKEADRWVCYVHNPALFSICSLDPNPNRGEGFENDGECVTERSGTTNTSITVARLRSPLTELVVRIRRVETKRERGSVFGGGK
jgi:hypothetical protein